MVSKQEKIQEIRILMSKYDIKKSYLSSKTKISRPTIDRVVKENNADPNEATVDVLYNFLISEYSPETVNESRKEYIKNKNGNRFVELPDGRYRIFVKRVPFKAYASYVEVYNDVYSTENTFEETSFVVDHIGRGRYESFVTINESMNGGGIYDTPGGAEVLARELGKHHWQDGFKPTDYGWIIICRHGMYHKDIVDSDVKGKVICRSRNESPEHQDFELILDDVHSIWKIIKRQF